MDVGTGDLIMAKVTHVTLDWGDGTYRFHLPIGLLEEHDEACGAGPMTVLARLSDGSWRVPDLRDTIRLGLIGGGETPAEAEKLVRRYVDRQPLIQAVPVAMVILAAALRGEDAPAVGKGEAAKPETGPDLTGSTSPPSDAPPSPSASAEASLPA